MPAVAAVVIRAEEAHGGKQGLPVVDGVSAERVGARALWMGRVTIPPGGRAKAHLHCAHETAIYTLQGAGELWYGEGLRERASFRAGDFVYIGAGVPHLPVNPSADEPVVAIIARTDPNEQESVELLPELDAWVP